MKKLGSQHKHILKRIDEGKNDEGWTRVSDALYPHILLNMPKELVEFSGNEGSYQARLTEEGVSIINAMKWL
jgi:hypothetical protein